MPRKDKEPGVFSGHCLIVFKKSCFLRWIVIPACCFRQRAVTVSMFVSVTRIRMSKPCLVGLTWLLKPLRCRLWKPALSESAISHNCSVGKGARWKSSQTIVLHFGDFDTFLFGTHLLVVNSLALTSFKNGKTPITIFWSKKLVCTKLICFGTHTPRSVLGPRFLVRDHQRTKLEDRNKANKPEAEPAKWQWSVWWLGFQISSLDKTCSMFPFCTCWSGKLSPVLNFNWGCFARTSNRNWIPDSANMALSASKSGRKDSFSFDKSVSLTAVWCHRQSVRRSSDLCWSVYEHDCTNSFQWTAGFWTILSMSLVETSDCHNKASCLSFDSFLFHALPAVSFGCASC